MADNTRRIEKTDAGVRLQLREAAGELRTLTLEGEGDRRVDVIVGYDAGAKQAYTQGLAFGKGWSEDDAIAYAAKLEGVEKEGYGFEIKALDEVKPQPVATKAADLYRQLARRPGVTRAFVPSQIKSVRDDEASADIILSTNSIDRQRETMDPMGLTIPKPKRVPLVSGHNYADLTKHIGDLRNIKAKDDQVHATADYFAGMGNPEADWAFTLAKMGVAAYSIGFLPIKYEDADLSDEKTLQAVLDYKKPLRNHTKWELMEGSHVVVPANREAVQRMVKAGILPESAIGFKGLSDEPMSTKAAETFTKALEAYASMKDDGEKPQWEIHGKKGLPMDDGDWNADEAHQSLDQQSGGDANQPEHREPPEPGDDHKDAHVVHDVNAPDKHTSYKLQFAKRDKDGKLVASKAALEKIREKAKAAIESKAAEDDIPDEVWDSVKDFADDYLGDEDDVPGGEGDPEDDTGKGIKKDPNDIMHLFEAPVGAKAGEWRVGGARKLPLDEESSWDAGEARKALKGDDEEPSARFRRGHIVFDASNSKEFGAYKLPFATVKDGKMVAVKRGLEAARGRLNQTDIPAVVKEAAGRFIDSYLGKEGEPKKPKDAGEITVKLRVDAEEMREAINDAVAALTRAFEEALQKAETRMADVATKAARDAFGPDSAAHAKLSDIISGVMTGAKELVAQEIAVAKGDAAAWLRKHS